MQFLVSRVNEVKSATAHNFLQNTRFRKLAASILILVYLLGGSLHALCNLDVTKPASIAEASVSAAKDVGSSSHGVMADHHCHGCFSVSIPTPSLVSALVEPMVTTVQSKQWFGTGSIPAIDTPPPKFLT